MNNEKNKKTEDFLNSLDGMKRATAPDFFYTRLKARMEKELVTSTPKSRQLRPVYAFMALVVVLCVNAAVLFQNNNDSDVAVISNNDAESIQALASEYSVTDTGSLYDLNLEK